MNWLIKAPPDWFEDGPLTRPYGLTTPQLAYDPPLAPGEQLTFVRKDHAGTPDLALCWEQAEPARKLVNLEKDSGVVSAERGLLSRALRLLHCPLFTPGWCREHHLY
ncbi:hypothetical protein ACFS07_34345 [Undibacterium arcticum]